MSASTERRLTAGFALALLVLAINALVCYGSISRLIVNSNLVNHTREVLNDLESLVSTLREAEIAERSYIITGRREDAETLERTSASSPRGSPRCAT
jgi:CHASE3 domain sensor protein